MCSTAPRYPICAKYPTLYPPECPKCPAYPAALSSSSDCADYNKFVEDASNSKVSRIPKYEKFGHKMGILWEEWDLRITILYILWTQLCLLFFARRRRRSMSTSIIRWINLNVSLLYIFSDLFGAIALGKLSEVKDKGEFNREALSPFDEETICKPHKPESLLRGLWAPVILFYLGGPDTITLLYIEETQLWLRHLISLLTQGARTCYVLIATWTVSGLSVLTLLMFISGIIKYAERTWAIRSRTRAISEGFVNPCDRTTIPLDITSISTPPLINAKLELKEKAKRVVEGYICFQTLRPHIPGYRVPTGRLEKFIEAGRPPLQIFKLIEIELGFMYDVLFSKVGTIFTAWGFILRYVTLSCAVCVLVGFFMVDKPQTKGLRHDVQITVVLLLGAIFLEMVGLLVQLVSDWGVVWACKHPSKLSSPILFLHEHRIFRKQRWSGEVGQLSLLDLCTRFEAPAFNKMVGDVRGWRKLLSINSSLCSGEAICNIKELIIDQLRERSPKNSGQPSKISSMKAGEWTLPKYGMEQALEWTKNVEFGEAIVLWHLATDICYHSEYEEFTCEIERLNNGEVKYKKYIKNVKKNICEIKRSVSGGTCDEASSPKLTDDAKAKAAKSLSYYMMHLLLIRYHTLPFCNTDGDFLTACTDIIEILKDEKLENQKLKLADACQRLMEETPRKPRKSVTVERARDLASALMQKPKEERWEIMSSMWVEMLCYAAKECNVKYHAQELRHGGEFLTHVWLLLMHFGIYGDQDRIIPPDLRPNALEGIKGVSDMIKDAVDKLDYM